MFHKFFSCLCIFASCTIIFSCSNRSAHEEGPKQRLQDYISRSFEVRGAADRQNLLIHLTGDAKSRLASWSDEQFVQAFVESKRRFLKLAFKEVKPRTDSEVDITYELSYMDQSKGHDAKVTQKKLCQLVRDQGKWLIRDVHNIKELVEYENEMALP